jgi:hypothetical protein
MLLATMIREQGKTDETALIVSSREDYQVEAHARLAKSEIKHIWEYMIELYSNNKKRISDIEDQLDKRLDKLNNKKSEDAE